MTLSATAALAGIVNLGTDVSQVNHSFGYGLLIFAVIALVAGVTAFFVLPPSQAPEKSDNIAQATGGSVAIAGEKNIVNYMPHFGNIMVGVAEQAQQKLMYKGRRLVPVSPAYLSGFYEQYTSIQADKLAQAYIGQWIKVSRSVWNINAISNQQLFVVTSAMEDNQPFMTMVFDGSWGERLHLIKRNDKITVVGQIKDVSRTTVELDNCELAD